MTRPRATQPTPYIDQDEETLLQRTRRRIAQGRCPACGTIKRRAILCETCRTTLKYCPACELIKLHDAFNKGSKGQDRRDDQCRVCLRAKRRDPKYLEYYRNRYHARQAAAGYSSQSHEAWLVERNARRDKALALYADGVSAQNIANELGITRNAVYAIFYRAKRQEKE